ncbi:adhesin [Virgibacillus phasianinus]|uniref:Adhesin n=1 Tax=Virgibacillus phasianinus TaxID=2017483 RepID=A0A220U4Z7_9BACI|nr:zinc ABC transporter substrate-binding protein [Virgibacillus phasianinus]ASK62803.1 adhesin [Virgibacillus phasianinus]
MVFSYVAVYGFSVKNNYLLENRLKLKEELLLNRIGTFLSILLLLLIIMAGCSSPSSDENEQAGMKIYTSIYPIQYITERIGGDTVQVESVYPPGVDAHTYEPTTKEMTSIADSEAFIYLGAGMEGFAESAADALNSEDVALIELGKHEELFHTEKRNEDHHHDDGHHHGDHNPHIWLDPIRMIDMAGIIKGDLIELNPEEKELYVQNFTSLKKDLLALDKEFRTTLQNKENTEILVSHAAYGYWESRYGIEQIAISGLTSSDEPSQKELTQIIDKAKKDDINYVIFEQNGSDRVSQIIQEQIGAKALQIHNLSVLTEEDIQNDEDYFSLMKHNLSVLDQATD